jgi:hypothetical protein
MFSSPTVFWGEREEKNCDGLTRSIVVIIPVLQLLLRREVFNAHAARV